MGAQPQAAPPRCESGALCGRIPRGMGAVAAADGISGGGGGSAAAPMAGESGGGGPNIAAAAAMARGEVGGLCAAEVPGVWPGVTPVLGAHGRLRYATPPACGRLRMYEAGTRPCLPRSSAIHQPASVATSAKMRSRWPAAKVSSASLSASKLYSASASKCASARFE